MRYIFFNFVIITEYLVCVFIILLYQYFRQVTLFPVCLYIRYRNKAGCASYDEERKECDSGSSMGATRNNPMYVGGVLLTVELFLTMMIVLL